MERNARFTRQAGRAIAAALLAMASSSGFGTEPDEGGGRRVLQKIMPNYPELARQMHVTGMIVLKIVVEPDGHVSAVHAESGHPLLEQSAEEAVRRWRFAASAASTTTRVQVLFK